MSRRVWTALPLLLLASGLAEAEQSAPWLARYDVVSGCPNRASFTAAVERRVSGSLASAFAELQLAISIERTQASGSESLLGKLDVTDAAGLLSTRELRASSCPQLVEALSLLAAVATDAARSQRAAPLSASLDQPSTGERESARVAAEQARDLAPRAGGAAKEAARFGPSVYVLFQNAATPEPELGAGVGLSLALPARGFWAPWFQVGAYRVQSSELAVGAAGVRARFELAAAHVVACPLRVPSGGFWGLRPCAELDVGRLDGEGGGTALTRITDRGGAWASSALSLRGEVDPWGPLSLGASIGGVLPWTRHEFFFAPDTEAFSVPRLGFRGTLSGALMF